MEEKQVKKLPPFSHIKVLENGNYGCTLLVADKIYNAVFTTNWECVERIHLVEVDAYADFDYKLKDGLNQMFDKEEGYTNDEDLTKDLSLSFEDENIMVDEEISQEALFISQYENSTGDISLTLENTLLPYKYFIPSFLDEVFFKFYCCGCGRDWSGCKLCWDRVGKVFGISLVCNDNAFDRALKQVIMEYQTFDDKVFDLVDEKYPDVAVASSEFENLFCEELERVEIDFKQRLSVGEYDFCSLGYLQYLMDNCKEYFDGILD